MKIFSGTSNEKLSFAIADYLGCPLGKITHKKFPSGETYCQFEENIRGEKIYLIQGFSPPANEALMELFIMSDAARRSSAGEITAVCPMFFYTRQDRKDRPRVPISARLIMDLAEAAGVQRIVTMDLHADQVGGFWNKPFDHLHFTPSLVRAISGFGVDVVVAPDVGSIKRTTVLSKILSLPMAIVVKNRLGVDRVEALQFIGDVEDKTVLIVDDLTESASTLIESAKECKQNGAKNVFCAITHGCFTDTGYQRLMDAFSTNTISHLFTSNSVKSTIDWGVEKDKVTVVDVAPVFAKAIHNIHNNASVSELFK